MNYYILISDDNKIALFRSIWEKTQSYIKAKEIMLLHYGVSVEIVKDYTEPRTCLN